MTLHMESEQSYAVFANTAKCKQWRQETNQKKSARETES